MSAPATETNGTVPDAAQPAAEVSKEDEGFRVSQLASRNLRSAPCSGVIRTDIS